MDEAALGRVTGLLAALPEPAPPATTRGAQDVELAGGFEQVIDVLTQHVGRPQPAGSGPGEDAFADIKSAFAELRQALGLPTETFSAAFSLPIPVVSADESAQRMATALAEAHTYADWYNGTPEWRRITTVAGAARALMTAIRDTAGDYWQEVSRDIRVRGFTRTVAARTARAISIAAGELARGLSQDGHGHPRVRQAAQHLSRAAAECATRLMVQSGRGGADRMSEVADIIASLGRSAATTGPDDPVTAHRTTLSRQGTVSSPFELVRACFPGPYAHRAAKAGHHWAVSQTRMRKPRRPEASLRRR